jgi:hypothetical protein
MSSPSHPRVRTHDLLQDGVESYLGLLKGAKVNAAAKAVDDKMTAIMTKIGKTGFTGFSTAYNAKVNAVIASYVSIYEIDASSY